MEVINNGVCVNKRDYRGQIKQVCVNNSWAAVLCDGSVQLHSIE